MCLNWPFSDDEERLEEDDEPYESDFIDDGALDIRAFSDDSVPEGQRYNARASATVPGPSRSRMRTVVITSSDDEHSSAASDADNWESYLGRTARRHGSDTSSPIIPRPPRRAAAVAMGAARDSLDISEGESDWAPRPRHERLASEERAARRAAPQRRTAATVVIIDDEDPASDDGRVPRYLSVSEDEDDIRPPWAYRRGPRHVVNVDDGEDENSADDVFEDAASALTATSAGRQSSRHQSGATDSEMEEVTPQRRSAPRRRPFGGWRDEEETEVDVPARDSSELSSSENGRRGHTSDESDSEDDHSDVSSEDSF